MEELHPPQTDNPDAWNSKRIGLLGGTFDPPHEGHAHISNAALRWLELDAIWWLVTPQNPAKDGAPSAPYEERIALCQSLTRDMPGVVVSDLEKTLNTKSSFDSIIALQKAFPNTEFVWISGLDHALNFHKWSRWKELLAKVCTVYMPREYQSNDIPDCPLSALESQDHIVPEKPQKYALLPGTSYWLMQENTLDISSSEIRNII